MTDDQKAVLDADDMARQYLALQGDNLSALTQIDERSAWYRRLNMLMDAYYEFLIGNVRRQE